MRKKNRNKDNSLYVYKNKCAHMLTDEHKSLRNRMKDNYLLLNRGRDKENNEDNRKLR